MRLSRFAKIIIVVLIGAMTVIGLSGLIFIVPSNQRSDSRTDNTTVNSNLSSIMRKTTITTEDGKNIVGNYYQPAGEIKGWVLYLHMMPATKESYSEIATRLQGVGYAGLAIDLRGHGESQDGPDGYKNYSAEQHQSSIKDVEASVNFLLSQGANVEDITLVGASIGANLAIQYASEHKEIKKVVALSPGLDYHGIRAGDLVRKFDQSQKLFIAGSSDDPNVPGDDIQIKEITNLFPFKQNITVKLYEIGGHGTDILKNQPELEDLIVGFIVD